MKRTPIIAIIISIIGAIYIYLKFDKSPADLKKLDVTLNEEIQDALSNIENAESPEEKMKGILKMRSLSEKYPENIELQWSMGLFSMQSGQYEKAVTRFQKVLSLDSTRLNAYINIAACYIALEDSSSARNILNILIENSTGEIQESANVMLEKLKGD